MSERLTVHVPLDQGRDYDILIGRGLLDEAGVRIAALGGRAFASDPGDAEAALRDAVAGWRAGGVAATVKHFPGLGGATVNTDDGPATIDAAA